MLRADAWGRLFQSKRDGQLLLPILAVCGDENGDSLLGRSTVTQDRPQRAMSLRLRQKVQKVLRQSSVSKNATPNRVRHRTLSSIITSQISVDKWPS